MDRATVEVEYILSKLDLNGSGEVDYSGNTTTTTIIKISKSGYWNNYFILEFLLATINLSDMLNKEKLRAAFKLFDFRNKGKITISDIKSVLRGSGAG